ncbi:MAG: hypothetical protein U0359_25900 [Byssovorax sp.]
MKRLAVAASFLLLPACSATPPPHWAEGGALLDVLPSRWILRDGNVEIAADGRVTINGEHELSIDRAGRVYDPDAKPVALLERDGHLAGPGDSSLGFVGALSAALPGEQTAWLSIQPTGEVIQFVDGTRSSEGVWVGGCNYSWRSRQACMLVSHIVGQRLKGRRSSYYPRSGYPYGMSPGYAPGMGIGIYR